MSEQTVVKVDVGDLTAADIAGDDEAARAAFQRFMEGNRYGGPSRQEQVGVSSLSPDEIINQPAPPTLREQVQAAEQQLAALQGQPIPVEDEASKFKKLYGDSENEKGELRRKLVELEETLNLVLSQQAQPTPPQSFQPQYQPPYQQPPNYPAPPKPLQLFEGKAQDDLVSVADVERIVQQQIAPAFAFTHEQAQAALNELSQMRKQAFEQAKRQAGITQVDDIRLRAKYPYLNQMPDSSEKVGLMQTLLGSNRPTEAQPQAAQPAASQPTPLTNNPVVRRVTHTESNRGTSVEPITNQNVLFQSELQEASRLPFEQRAAAMEKVFRKYGVPNVNTYGIGGRQRV